MMLQPFKDTGYVWNSPKQTGSRIVVVVDDCYDVVEEIVQSSHAFGLFRLLDEIHKWDDTRAIGFFNLPESGEAEELENTIRTIDQWIDQVCSDERDDCQVYVLVDYYFGEGFVRDKSFGYQLVDYWMEHTPFKAELAHLSIGGADLDNPHRLKIFRKTKIHENRELPSELQEWLDYNQHPLDRMWKYQDVHNWFTFEHLVMQHDSTSIYEYFFGNDAGTQKAERYRNNVEAAIGVKFPDAWWNEPNSVKHIHDSLKCLCGAYFCGQSAYSGKRPLCVGATYLIALMAHQRLYKNIEIFAADPTAWSYATKLTSYVFAVQDQETAQSSAKALYDFFVHILMPRGTEGVSAFSEGKSTVKKAYFDEDGKVLRIQLWWSAATPPDRSEQQHSLAHMAKKMFSQSPIAIPRSSGNTRDAVLRLWNHLAISEEGFMSPGVVYMENDTIVVASRK